MKNLIQAVNQVMVTVQNIEKATTIGNGRNSYKGVSDKDVKLMFNRAFRANGLAIFQTKVEPTTKVERWVEDSQYGPKQKQSVFAEVVVTYTLMHTSGESIELQGYGHGVDTQDKAAGKATTYALKYALLYNFLVATGDIDDADAVHSDAIVVPQMPQMPQMPEVKKQLRHTDTENFQKVIDYITTGKLTIEKLVAKYDVDAATLAAIKDFTAPEQAPKSNTKTKTKKSKS